MTSRASSLCLHVQVATEAKNLPSRYHFRRWISYTLSVLRPPTLTKIELTVRIVDVEEGRALNSQYRQKDYPTNVLSFPFDSPNAVESPCYLGDIVLCEPQIVLEAQQQGKKALAHWAHLSIHGLLHLLGYDHETSSTAQEMESLEVFLLGKLGYPNPYP